MNARPAFVLVHGYWHGASTWRHVVPRLQAKGHPAHALDLPGAGALAATPAGSGDRPAAFAAEASPAAGISQEERTQRVIDAIQAIPGPVVLVGHSMGGVTISDVAEAIPGRLAAVVYLCAFLLPPGVPPMAMLQHDSMAGQRVPPLLIGDPQRTGALRIDPRSADPDYRALLRSAFYADVDDRDVAAMLPDLHCDEPAGTALRPSAISAGRFGTVPRHYIRCTEDRAIPIAGQDFMLDTLDAALGNRTLRHTLAASHSPFLSMPDALAGLLETIALGRP